MLSRRLKRFSAIAAAAALPGRLFAHDGEPLAPHDLWTAWSWDPFIVAGLAATTALYLAGARSGRGFHTHARASYWTGWCILALALLSPVHALGEVLFSAHMFQHELLMLVAAPLIVLGRPLTAFLWGVPPRPRQTMAALARLHPIGAAWEWTTRPLNAWWIHGAAIWIWHLPSLFEATVHNDFVHALQHLSFLGTGILFWSSLLESTRSRKRDGLAVLSLFTTAMHTGLLGVLLTLSPAIWYREYTARAPAWGIAPLRDQQIGGLIMWIPSSLIYVGAALFLLARWISPSVGPAAQAEAD